MKRKKVVVFSARGARSFDPKQLRLLKRVAKLQIVTATKPLSRSRFVQICKDAEIIGLTPRSAPQMKEQDWKKLSRVRLVALPTTGTEWLELEPLRKAGIRVSNVPGFSTISGAEFAIAMMLSLSRKLPVNFQYHQKNAGVSRLGSDLHGKILGLVGFGSIGQQLGKLATVFGMQVQFFDPHVQNHSSKFKKVGLTSLLKTSDFVSLQCPLNDETFEMFSAGKLALMKRGSYLINTARPQIVHHPDLLLALKKGKLNGYAVDTGYLKRSQFRLLLNHPQIICVPHVSWYTKESIAREMQIWLTNILQAATGKIVHSIA
jgi:phosphoglycerate dehydrogenase-like enzyme